MWRSYYDHHPVRLLVEMNGLLRTQFHLPFWRSCAAAWYAARAAVIFQKGHSRADYMRALPYLVRYYGVIRRASATRRPLSSYFANVGTPEQTTFSALICVFEFLSAETITAGPATFSIRPSLIQSSS